MVRRIGTELQFDNLGRIEPVSDTRIDVGFDPGTGSGMEFYKIGDAGRPGYYILAFGGNSNSGKVEFIQSTAAEGYVTKFRVDYDGADACGLQIRNLIDPTANDHAARKGYVDARVGDAANITTGTLDNARLPAVLSGVRTVNPSGGTISIDANGAGNTIESTLTGDATLNVPTNGSNTQILQGIVLASGAQRVLTFHASLGRLTAIANTLTIPSGKVGRYALRRTDITGSAKWLVESVGVEQ